jgi:D-alanyl-D-alanine carboxypeptidase (penicillin-binding protein 5/6)
MLLSAIVSTASAASDAPPVVPPAPAAPGIFTGPITQAKTAILLDSVSGRALWSKATDERVQPASLVKLMTLKIAYEAMAQGKIKASDLVNVSSRAWRTGGSRMFLQVGSKVKIEDLLKGISVVSGNDACIALAEFIAGTVETFVAMMNKRAQELGLASSHFSDPHGISGDNYMTAADIAKLAMQYVKDHPESLAIHSMKEFTYTPQGGRPITQQNRNRLLGQYDGADGLKTGHTEKAGYNLVATAQRDGTRFFVVVMGLTARTEPLGENLRAEEAGRILDYAFATYKTVTLVSQGEQFAQARVWKGATDQVPVGAAEEMKYTVLKGSEGAATRSVSLSSPLVAPLKKGQVVGSATITLTGSEPLQVKMVALKDVAAGSLLRRIIDSLRLLFQRSVKVE